MLKKFTKILLCFVAVLVVGLLLMGNADAAKKQHQKQQNVVWQLGYEMPDGSGFRVLDELGTKEECLKSTGPDPDKFYTEENQDIYPGKKLHVICKPDYF